MLKKSISLVIAMSALVFSGGTAQAYEAVGGARSSGRETIAGGSSSNAGSTGGSFSNLPTEDASAVMVDGRAMTSQLPFLPDVERTHNNVCGLPGAVPSVARLNTSGKQIGLDKVKNESGDLKSLCSKWDEASKSYEAAAKSLGVPQQVLICLTQAETSLTAGLSSPVGAQGLTQFMPATASDYEDNFQKSSKYKKAWQDYLDAGGSKTMKSSSSFTKENIRSTDIGQSDVQIFASAMYFREFMIDTEDVWKSKVGEPPYLNKKEMKRLFHSFMISYNAGPAVGKKYMNGTTSFNELPKETRGYLYKFNACMGFTDDPKSPDDSDSRFKTDQASPEYMVQNFRSKTSTRIGESNV